MRNRRLGPRPRAVVAALSAVAMLLPWHAPGASATSASHPLSTSASGANGVGRITAPGLPCADGGAGAYRHYAFERPISGVIANSIAGNLRGSLVVHHDGDEPVGEPISPAGNQAFLLGTESHTTLSNERGAVQLRLSAAGPQRDGSSCPSGVLSFDGTTIAGGGTWSLDPVGTNGAYRGTTGSGTFTVTAGVAPGADNPWTIALDGSVAVPQPVLKVEVVKAYWGGLGVDYLTRRVSVTYRITNEGVAGPDGTLQGDAFHATLVSTSSSSGWVQPLGPQPQPLGDLLAGASTLVTVRYQLGLLGPCALIILGCNFPTTVSVDMPDAMDISPGPQSQTVNVHAPDLPPPL